MNLETFKARARRKLELPGHRQPAAASVSDQPDAPEQIEPSHDPSSDSAAHNQAKSMTPPNAPASTSAITDGSDQIESPTAGAERFAAAFKDASEGSKSTTTLAPPPLPPLPPSQRDPRRDNFDAKKSTSESSIQAVTGSPAKADPTSDNQLAHLRALLMGNQSESQQDQVDEVYRRTQSGLNSLRRDMDARLTDLSDYVEQLEQSLLNSVEAQSSDLSEDTAQILGKHEQRLDALDARVGDFLATVRADLDKERANHRDHLETKLAAITERNDRTLKSVSERLERSIADMQSNLSKQLSDQSGQTLKAPEATIADLREKLSALIDERVHAINAEQTSNMTQLRETVLAHTGSIKAELQAQTQEQSAQLRTHREEMETQFNRAILSLNDNKVSHRQLSQLLTRLADRIQEF